jgi:hypothetical protein
MKTEELISAMAADAKSTEMPIARTLWLAVAAGTILAAILFFVEVGPRADLTGALTSPRFLFKCALTLMLLIPLLSAAPLVAVIIALRHGAPTHPILSGAAAGLLSAGIGATLYATHCQSDSPLFVAVWYVAATLIVTLVGAILGARLLRW